MVQAFSIGSKFNMEKDKIYTVLLFINMFRLYHKKLDKMHKGKFDVEAKYFRKLMNISLSNMLNVLTTAASK